MILPGTEDFGLVPLEAAAAGRATIALGAGGACETIRDGETGILVADDSDEGFAAAIRAFDPARFPAGRLRAHAYAYRPERFVSRLRATVDAVRALHERGEEVERRLGSIVPPSESESSGASRT